MTVELFKKEPPSMMGIEFVPDRIVIVNQMPTEPVTDAGVWFFAGAPTDKLEQVRTWVYAKLANMMGIYGLPDAGLPDADQWPRLTSLAHDTLFECGINPFYQLFNGRVELGNPVVRRGPHRALVYTMIAMVHTVAHIRKFMQEHDFSAADQFTKHSLVGSTIEVTRHHCVCRLVRNPIVFMIDPVDGAYLSSGWPMLMQVHLDSAGEFTDTPENAAFRALAETMYTKVPF